MPNGVNGQADMHRGEDAGEVICYCFVPGKVLLEEIGKSAGNWYSVQHFLAAFLSLLCAKIRYLFTQFCLKSLNKLHRFILNSLPLG